MEYSLQYYYEHYNGHIPLPLDLPAEQNEFTYLFTKKKGNQPCYNILKNIEPDKSVLTTSYFIGVDWVHEGKLAIYVAPKLNTKLLLEEGDWHSIKETDYLNMLFSCIKHPEVSKEIKELFEIKWDKPEIIIEQKKDLLTPLLVVQYLVLVKDIVRKGLKKAYYRVNENLYAKVKGKVNVSQTIKRNLLRNKKLNTSCSFEEFGLNCVENRLLKKALLFIRKYLPTYLNIGSEAYIKDLINYISPAFDTISDEVDLSEIRHPKPNIFYKEYDEAIRLSKLILSRYGYNISNIEKETISTPPFWIDMSKLFELYVLGLLKDRFQSHIQYHFTHYGNELDFILRSEKYKLVIDAKYKPKYIDGKLDEDIRQVSGYARLKKVYDFLEKQYPESIDCLIIYPDQENGHSNLSDVELLTKEVSSYNGVFKLGVKLPLIS